MIWPQSRLQWFGLVLVVAGLGLIPLALPALETLRLSLSKSDFRIALAVLLLLGDGLLIVGVLILMPRVRLTHRQLNRALHPGH